MRKYKIGITLFFGVLFVVGLINLIAPKPTHSDQENRDLAKMPEFSWESLANGKFISEYQTYFSDTFLARDMLVRFAGEFKSLKGISGDDDVIWQEGTGTNDPGIAPPGDNSASSAPSESQPSDDPASSNSSITSEAPESNPDTHLPDDDVQTISGIMVAGNTALQLYGFNEAVNLRYSQVISSFAQKYPEIKTGCLVAPINTEFYIPEKYRNKSADEKKAIDTIYGNMTGVTTYDAYSKLAAHADEYIYFRTDHHWTQLGAYYAYTAFAETAGFDPIPLEQYETFRYDSYLGSLYRSHANDAIGAKLAKDPDYIEAYLPFFNYTLKYYPEDSMDAPASYLGKGTLVQTTMKKGDYLCFIHGDQPLERIDNEDNKNGKNILVIKESYGNAFVPLLVPHYETVFVVDPRYFKLSLAELIEKNNIQEVLFVNNIMTSGTTQRINEWEKLINS